MSPKPQPPPSEDSSLMTKGTVGGGKGTGVAGPPLWIMGSGLSCPARMMMVRSSLSSRVSPGPSGTHVTAHNSFAEPRSPAVKLALRLRWPSPLILCSRLTQPGPQDFCPATAVMCSGPSAYRRRFRVPASPDGACASSVAVKFSPSLTLCLLKVRLAATPTVAGVAAASGFLRWLLPWGLQSRRPCFCSCGSPLGYRRRPSSTWLAIGRRLGAKSGYRRFCPPPCTGAAPAPAIPNDTSGSTGRRR